MTTETAEWAVPLRHPDAVWRVWTVRRSALGTETVRRLEHEDGPPVLDRGLEIYSSRWEPSR